MRRSASCHQSSRGGEVACLGGDAGECIEGEDLDMGGVVLARARSGSRPDVPRRRQPAPRRPSPRAGTRRARPALRHRRRGATPSPSRARSEPARARPSARSTRPEMHPGECRHAHVAGRLGLLDRELERGGAGLVVAGLALRPSETRDLVRLRLQEPETSRRLRGTTEVDDGVVEPMLDAGQFAEHRFAANVEPRVVDHRRASAGPDRALRRCASSSPAEIAARAAKSQFARLVPRPVRSRRRARAA